MLWLPSIVITLAWGVGAFGSVYQWAYLPLTTASAILGIAGLWMARNRNRLPVFLTMALVLVALAGVVQLVPLSTERLTSLTPQAVVILKQHNLAYQIGLESSHGLSIEPSRTVVGLTFFVSFSLLLLGTGQILTRDDANRLAWALMVLGSALAVTGIVQNATRNGKIYGFWQLVQGGSPFGPFVNRNHFAGWMLMAIPVVLGYFFAIISRGMEGRQPGFRNFLLWFSTEQANRAILTAFTILVMVLSLVLTFSRSGITALAVALLLAGTMTVRRQSGVSKRALAIGYIVALSLIVVSWVGLDQISARFAAVNLADVNERPAIWADTIRIIKDFWLTGTGLNTYGVSTLFYQTSVPGRHLREAHSDYLQLAAEGGLLVGIPVVLAIVAFALEVRRRFRQDSGSIWWIRMGAITGLIAIALQSAVEFSLQMPGNAALFAVIAGMAIHDGRTRSGLVGSR